ncbi:MAG: metallophosphatase family protein [Alphaproteobacteria bacterium]|nr:metallophosphatase family protein [Alphaproteobacteria bacterium]NNF23564.1 hypothetical protein [Paracoccaceae bacterium]
MRIGIIADIHGNIDALDAVLAALDRMQVDEVVNLGDSFSGPLDAAAVAERLLPLNLPSVRGNTTAH